MNDQELCKAMYKLRGEPLHELSDNAAGRAVRHWEAAGALMEKCRYADWSKSPGGHKWFVRCYPEIDVLDETPPKADAHNKSLPRAIIEAFVKAHDLVQGGRDA